MNICFKNIRLINPTQNIDKVTSLWIKDGIIQAINEQFEVDTNTEIIDATGLVASPGFFDMHVHFRDPGFEYKEDIDSGVNSAANGGFTGVVVMPNTNPVIDNKTVISYINTKAKDKLVDVFVSGTLTQNQDGTHLSNMMEMASYGAVLFTDDGKSVMNSDTMRRIFEYSAPSDLLISQHCEEHNLTKGFDMNESDLSIKLGLKGYPSVAEEIILMRDIYLSEFTGNRRYHAQHISTCKSVDIIKDAKKKGQRVSCEVTPHHISLTDDLLATYCTNYKMNPPLRKQSDIDAIIEGLKDGTIDVIATDHAPHSKLEKETEFDKAMNGIVGLETAFGIAYTYLVVPNHLTLNQLIEKMSINARKLLKLSKVVFEEGAKANITIFDPNEEWIVDSTKFLSKSVNTPYNNHKLTGKIKYTINNEKIHFSTL